ncbi:CLUMA_CG014078, isoform A [Clunio marinus]|uniref:CLUMA_CG014078, isoform A n=1 Tax=Clunio marinus TaxID=568069 RepID=A0A1J1IKR9_9DIPT|nr:CLUMA_CG014078, isoform A [Clunio marinus]
MKRTFLQLKSAMKCLSLESERESALQNSIFTSNDNNCFCLTFTLFALKRLLMAFASMRICLQTKLKETDSRLDSE